VGANKLKKNQEQITKDSILKVGNVISVDGRTVKIKVDKSKNVSHLLFNGETIKNISVGGYVKIRKGFEIIVGKIDGEFVTENRLEKEKEYQHPSEKVDRILEVKLVGFYDAQVFKKGIKELPLIDNECFLLDKAEYADVHNFVRSNDIPLEIGVLANDKGVSISVGVNSLFASHIGIFGNTGSGKSYTLAGIYFRLFKKFGSSDGFRLNAKFVLLDFNGEYISSGNREQDQIIAPPDLKKTYLLSTRTDGDKYPLSAEEINDDTLWIIAAEATEKTQVPFLRRSLRSRQIDECLADGDSLKRFLSEIIVLMAKSKNKELLSVINNFIKDLENPLAGFEGLDEVRRGIATQIGYFNNTSEFYVNVPGSGWVYANQDQFDVSVANLVAPLRVDPGVINIFNRNHLRIVLNFYLEISKGYSNRDHIAPMIKRLEKRVEDLAKVIQVETPENKNDRLLTIVSFKDVNIHMRKVLPLLICKELYEKKKREGNSDKYLNVIIDEAHNILSEESLRESEQWKDYRLETFEEIIKEGRKFGTFITIASQRPYDISPTIVSQLHNYLLHRLINENDLRAIENTVSFLDKVSFESLPILPTGSCVLSGLVSQIPVVIEIDEIPREVQPNSVTYTPTNFWKP